MSDDEALRRYLEVIADVRGYPYPERLGDWAARFGANASEREAFRQAPDPPPEVPPYRAVPPHDPPAPVAVPGNTGIAAIAAAAARGQVDARERAAAALQRAEAQADLHCFTALAKDAAHAPIRPGPLTGVTVGIKDLMRVQGLPLTGGSRALPGAVAAADAECVRRLRDAGGAIIGMTNLHELAYGITSINPHFGTVANPAAPGRIAGGSSGGSAAAVAAGLVDVALGSDTAGSVRIPAACCGVVGFKPSYGRIPTEAVLALGWSLDHVGTFARTVADAAACYAVAAGAPLQQQQQSPPALRNWTLLRPTGFFEACDPAVAACLDDLSARLRAAGFRIVSRPLPLMEYTAAIQFFTLCTEASEYHWRLLLEHSEGLGADVRVRLEIGQFIPAIDYQRAQRLRQLLGAGVAQAMSDVDALLVPTLPLPAPKLGENDVSAGPLRLTVHAAMTRFTAPFNLTGQPALTLPCGRTADGVPIGAQLVGRFGDDAGLLALAAAVEQVVTGD